MIIKMADYSVIRERLLKSNWTEPTFKDGKVYGRVSTKTRIGLEPLDWRDELKEFDILITPSGDLRVIRTADYDLNGRLYCVEVTTRKCNRFGSGFRTFFRWELKKLKKAEVKYRPTEKDYEIQKYLVDESKWIKSEKQFNCLNVKQFA
jgi:hypothetical protein